MVTALIVIILLILLVAYLVQRFDLLFRTPAEAAGRKGELKAAKTIRSILNENDVLINNVSISVEGKETELDNVVINNCGIFIIEVKNYKGLLEGKEDDFEWNKFHKSSGGKIYLKTVKNPIKQVKRQIYILSQYLQKNGIRTWVSGYAYLLDNNSPVESEMLLTSIDDIEKTIHTPGRKQLNSEMISKIWKLLE